VPEIRCIGANGEQLGVIATSHALRLAQDHGLDLVEVAPTARPPVCRIMDYGKYKYEMAKKEKSARRNQAAASKVKEVKFHANVADHDYQTKVRHIRDFLGEGHRVKVSLWFRGRENTHQEFGYEVMKRVVQDCSDISQMEQSPQLFGRNLIMRLAPRSGKARAQEIRPESPPQESMGQRGFA